MAAKRQVRPCFERSIVRGKLKELADLAQVLEGKRVEAPDAVLPDRAVVFPRLAEDAAERAVAFAAETHLDEDLGDVGRSEAVAGEVAQDRVIVASDAERRVVAAEALDDRAAQEERGVRRHPAVAQARGMEFAGTPVADYAVGVIAADVLQVAVDGEDVLGAECIFHTGQDIFVGKDIVRVKKPDYLTRCPGKALVKRVVDAVVGFAYDGCVWQRSTLYKLNGTVG